MKKLMIGVAAVATLLATTGAARAEREVLIRQRAPFDACMAVLDQMAENLGIDTTELRISIDTGALNERRYVSEEAEAELVLSCNRVTDVLEVRRETPDHS